MFDAMIENRDSITIIHLYGSLSMNTVNEFDLVCAKQTGLKPEVIAFEMENLEYIDSIGLSHFIQLLKRATVEEIELIFYNVSETVMQIFRSARFEKLFNILSADDFREKYLFEY